MLLTDQQLQEIRQIIADHHNAFIVNAISPVAVAPELLDALKAKGLVNVKVHSIQDAYIYGQVLAAMNNPATAGMTLDAFKAYLRKNPVPLSPIEIQSVVMNQAQAAQYVRGLGNRIDTQTGQLLIEADHALRRQMRDTITRKTEQNIAARESVKQLKSELGWATQDWTRDLDRIAITEKQSAFQHGTADHYAKQYGGDVLVAKIAHPDCCPRCHALYTGPDGAPRIFKLSDLEANGTNVGRKTGDWLPVVGPVHPHCGCTLVRVPAGWGFDEQGDLTPGGAFGIHVDPTTLQASLAGERELRKSLTTPGAMAEFQNLAVVIEQPVGAQRHWRSRDGDSGTTTMLYAYGYIRDTHGADGEEIDCYLGPDPRAANAYIVHQKNPRTGLYDEDKVMLGFANEADAKTAYLAHYNSPDFFDSLSTMPMPAFKRWLAVHAHAGETPQETPVPLTKSAPGGAQRLVIPLTKARIAASQIAGTTPAADHNPRLGGMDGANFLFNPPPAKPTVRESTLVGNRAPERALVTQYGFKPGEQALVRDKRIYEFREPVPRVTRMREMPDQWADPETRTKSAAIARQRLTARARQRAAFRFYADVRNERPEPADIAEQPELADTKEAPKPQTHRIARLVERQGLKLTREPVSKEALGKGVGFRSHKYINRERKGDRWVYTYPDTPAASHAQGEPGAKRDPAQLKADREKTLAKAWAIQTEQRLADYFDAGYHDAVSKAGLPPSDFAGAKAWIKTHARSLAKQGVLIADMSGKILHQDANKKKSRKLVSQWAFRHSNRDRLLGWAGARLGLDEAESTFVDNRAKVMAELAKVGMPELPGSEEWRNDEPSHEELAAWYKKAAPIAKKIGLTLVDRYGNQVRPPLKKLPEVPLTTDNLYKRLGEFKKATGFEVVCNQKGMSETRIATVFAAMRAVEGLGLIFKRPEGMVAPHVHVEGDAFEGAAAIYNPTFRSITIDEKTGKATFFHEFGHFIDHHLGEHQAFASHIRETPPTDRAGLLQALGMRPEVNFSTHDELLQMWTRAHHPQEVGTRYKPVVAFIEAAKQTESCKAWRHEDLTVQHGERQSTHRDYYRIPTEMFARFFDQWCHVKLKEKGHTPASYFSDPGYTSAGGAFSDKDFAELRPLFETALGKRLIKALEASLPLLGPL